MIDPSTDLAPPPATDAALDPPDHAGPSRELILPPEAPRETAPGMDALPEPPREGFELGAIDVSAERPTHGLAGSRSTRWLVGGLVGGSLVLAGLITLIRGDDEGDGAGIELRAALGDPLRGSMLALEAVRLEAINVSAVRALGDSGSSGAKATPRRSTRANEGATPATTTPAATTRGSQGGGDSSASGASAPASGDSSSPSRSRPELPPPPPADAEAPRGDASPSPAAPAEPPPAVDAPESEPRDDSGSAPSGV